jgi:S-DNA-T family DNA segregation ATPase FtsK/SpoIIIE
VLFTYQKGDPGWSHSTTTEQISNAGGMAGAHLADLLLFLFGMLL